MSLIILVIFMPLPFAVALDDELHVHLDKHDHLHLADEPVGAENSSV